MRLRPFHPRRAGFTLIELTLVLVILAVVAGLVVPSLVGFAAGRDQQNAVALVLGLSNYARTQAVSEGTVYRINFDAGAGQVWLTEQQAGAFAPPPNDYGKRYDLPASVRMSVAVTPGTVSVPIANSSVQQQAAAPAPPFGQPLSTPNTLVSVPHDDGGTYVEVHPGGRTDPCLIRLTGKDGSVVNVGCATETDVMHVLKPGEM